MIVRVMGEGQFEVADDLRARLNEIDDQAGKAVERGDEDDLHGRLEELARLVIEAGERLPDTHLAPSDLIVPPSDPSLEEARDLFTGEGLIPDLPVRG
jgi:PspA-Associated protein